ncbi:hypothetical protein [Oleiphilus messinensis]|nr:hypothetical protein [Oleiphilus messinensis]
MSAITETQLNAPLIRIPRLKLVDNLQSIRHLRLFQRSSTRVMFFSVTLMLLVGSKLTWSEEVLLALNNDIFEPIPDPFLKRPIASVYEDMAAEDGATRYQPISFWEQQMDWLIHFRNDWSHWISNTGRRVDAYFADEKIDSGDNSSYLRVRVGPTWASGEDFNFDPDIKFKLALPLTRERYQLVFESDPDDGKSLSDKSRENITGSQSTDDRATGALRLISELSQDWSMTNDVGIRLAFPPDPFVRSRAKRKWQIEPGLSTNLSLSGYYFVTRDWGADIKIHTDKELTSSILFRNTFETHWDKSDDSWEFGLTFDLFHELNRTRAIRYRFAMLADSKPDPDWTSFYLESTYRRRIYKNWLFYEIIPLVSFPEDKDFKPKPELTFKIEILFAKKR